MKLSLMKRLERLEDRQAPVVGPAGLYSGPLGEAILIAFALRRGSRAKEELAEAGTSLGTTRRAELEKQLAVARSIATALEAAGPVRTTPLSARTTNPESLDALLAAVI